MEGVGGKRPGNEFVRTDNVINCKKLSLELESNIFSSKSFLTSISSVTVSKFLRNWFIKIIIKALI